MTLINNYNSNRHSMGHGNVQSVFGWWVFIVRPHECKYEQQLRMNENKCGSSESGCNL